MVTIRNRSKGFSLLELLMVITVIAVLIALLTPLLTSGKLRAKLLQCQANHRSVYTAALHYGGDHKSGVKHIKEHAMPELLWRFDNNSEDAPNEAGRIRQPGNPAQALYLNQYLEDGRIFFCPLLPLNYETHFNPAPPQDFKTFWGSYSWRWRKIPKDKDPHQAISRNVIVHANEDSDNVVMTDSFASYWAAAQGMSYEKEHYNAVFSDGSVRHITDDEKEFRYWLFGAALVPYGEYPF